MNLNSGELERKCVEREIATKWLEIKTSIGHREWEKILDHIDKMQIVPMRIFRLSKI